jgi:hypothetical protein
MRQSADDERLALESRVQENFDGGEKSIDVDVGDESADSGPEGRPPVGEKRWIRGLGNALLRRAR